MIENTGQHSEHECHEDRADQPHPPGKADDCKGQPEQGTPPTLPEPTTCSEDQECKCPTGSSTTPTCLEDDITAADSDIAALEKAKARKTELEELNKNAKAASKAYTQEVYEKLVKLWVEEDKAIAELIRKLVCAVPCWRCIIECHVCRPIINQVHQAEEALYREGPDFKIYNLYDQLYWHQRDKEAKERRLNRIKSVFDAWGNPAKTIEGIINDNKGRIEAACKSLCPDAGKVVIDVFLSLVPLHLAIAPPSNSNWKTEIPKKYTQLCKCDTGTPDDCCGPDVGEWSLRQRLIGPQPYLIDPNAYIDLICCLVKTRYRPAKEALAKAEAEVVTITNKINRKKALIDNWKKSFDKDAKDTIPSVIDCCKYKKGETDSPTSQAR